MAKGTTKKHVKSAKKEKEEAREPEKKEKNKKIRLAVRKIHSETGPHERRPAPAKEMEKESRLREKQERLEKALRYEEKEAENWKRIVMLFGIVFFMSVITVFWISSLGKSFRGVPQKKSLKENALETGRAVEEDFNSLKEEMKRTGEIIEANMAAVAREAETASVSSSSEEEIAEDAAEMNGPEEKSAAERIKELEAKIAELKAELKEE